jgi:hypothetical protein
MHDPRPAEGSPHKLTLNAAPDLKRGLQSGAVCMQQCTAPRCRLRHAWYSACVSTNAQCCAADHTHACAEGAVTFKSSGLQALNDNSSALVAEMLSRSDFKAAKVCAQALHTAVHARQHLVCACAGAAHCGACMSAPGLPQSCCALLLLNARWGTVCAGCAACIPILCMWLWARGTLHACRRALHACRRAPQTSADQLRERLAAEGGQQQRSVQGSSLSSSQRAWQVPEQQRSMQGSSVTFWQGGAARFLTLVGLGKADALSKPHGPSPFQAAGAALTAACRSSKAKSALFCWIAPDGTTIDAVVAARVRLARARWLRARATMHGVHACRM